MIHGFAKQALTIHQRINLLRRKGIFSRPAAKTPPRLRNRLSMIAYVVRAVAPVFARMIYRADWQSRSLWQ